MAMYIEMFRVILLYRYERGKLHGKEFRYLRRKVALLNYDLERLRKKFRKR